LLLIDTLARTYGCLPSAVLKNADTFDLMVFDVAVANTEIQNAKANKKPIPSKYYKEEDLQERIDKTRETNG
jgi:hypothetical protein